MEGRRLLETAATEKKNANAQYIVSAFHERAGGKEVKKAVQFLKLAAAQKHMDAAARVAAIYTNGVKGVIDVNHAEALKFGVPAADAGHNNSIRVMMGSNLEFGYGGVVDIPKALKFYRAAAEEKHGVALSRLML